MAKLKSEIEVTCPCCRSSLVIDVNLGRVVSHREPERGDKPELHDASRILAGAGRAARGAVRAVGREREGARRCAVAAVRGSAEAGERRAGDRSRCATSIWTEHERIHETESLRFGLDRNSGGSGVHRSRPL